MEKNEIVKGYEYSKGQYVIIEPSELDNLRVPSKHTIAVSQFIEQAELNPEFVEKPYFVVPENAAQAEAFAVVRQALLKSGKVAIGKIAFPAANISSLSHRRAPKVAGCWATRSDTRTNSATRWTTFGTSRNPRSAKIRWSWQKHLSQRSARGL